MTGAELLDLCARASAAALEAGAAAAEVFASERRTREVVFEANDLKLAKTDEEVTLGIRVLCGRSMGFATTNEPEAAAAAAGQAVAMARASPSDPHHHIPEPVPLEPAPDGLADPAVAALGAEGLAAIAAGIAGEVRALDSRVSIDKITVAAVDLLEAVHSSIGAAAAARATTVAGDVIGMAREGSEVGSFTWDGAVANGLAAAREDLRPAVRRFVETAIGALHPRKGRTFKGKVILLPPAVGEVLAHPLVAALGADNVRKGRSPLGPRLGQPIASPTFHLRDPGTRLGPFAWRPFDREGQPRRPLDLVAGGVLRSFLYDCYEAKVAGRRSTGHAQGRAQAPPYLSAGLVEVLPGDRPAADLEAEADLALVVPRFSGRVEMATGDFSGVVKGGSLVERGSGRTPVTETMIAGNLYAALAAITAISSDRVRTSGEACFPAVVVDGIAVTAG